MLHLRIMNVGVISLAKIIAIIYALFGVVLGLGVALMNVFNINATGDAAQLQEMGYAAIIILPILYGLIGAVSGVVSAFFLNLAIGWVGPLEINVTEKQAPATTQEESAA